MRVVTTILLLTFGASACGGGTDPGGSGEEPADAPVGAWELVSAEPPIEVPAGARVTLTIEEDGGQLRAGGTAACNSYGGTLVLDGDAWTLAQVAVTEMACEPDRMEAESAYLETLAAVDTWRRDGDTLELTDGEATLTFEPLPEIETATLTGTTWEVDGYLTGSGDDGAVSSGTAGLEAPTVRFDEDGTVTVTTACRSFTGEWTTSGDQVQLPSFGEDDAEVGACEPAAEEQERKVLDVLESSGFTASVEGQRLTLRSGEAGLTARAAS